MLPPSGVIEVPLIGISFTRRLSRLILLKGNFNAEIAVIHESFSTTTSDVVRYHTYGSKPPFKQSRVPE
jgi:hypothetical protein